MRKLEKKSLLAILSGFQEDLAMVESHLNLKDIEDAKYLLNSLYMDIEGVKALIK